MSDYISKQALLEHLNTTANDLFGRGGIVPSGILVILRDEIEAGTFDVTEGDTEPVGAGVREPVQWFAERMESQLRKNDHKGGWGLDQCSMSYLAEMMHKKSSKYYNLAGSGYSIQGFIEQLADIANYAMMQADRLRGSVTEEGPSEE